MRMDGWLLLSIGGWAVCYLASMDCPNSVSRLQEHPSLSLIGELVGKSTPVRYFTSLLFVAIVDQDVEMGEKPVFNIYAKVKSLNCLVRWLLSSIN